MGLDLKELQDIAKNVIRSEHKYVLINGEHVHINEYWNLTIPYKKWRVVALGFTVLTAGVSTENPVFYWGKEDDDLSGWDWDCFGKITQDVNAGKHFIAGDCYTYDPKNLVAKANALNGGGSPTFVEGEYFDLWLPNIGAISFYRPNDHTLDVIPWVLLEVEII
jgi:hypothetical protein